jgi:hypothetical protein
MFAFVSKKFLCVCVGGGNKSVLWLSFAQQKAAPYKWCESSCFRENKICQSAVRTYAHLYECIQRKLARKGRRVQQTFKTFAASISRNWKVELPKSSYYLHMSSFWAKLGHYLAMFWPKNLVTLVGRSVSKLCDKSLYGLRRKMSFKRHLLCTCILIQKRCILFPPAFWNHFLLTTCQLQRLTVMYLL